MMTNFLNDRTTIFYIRKSRQIPVSRLVRFCRVCVLRVWHSVYVCVKCFCIHASVLQTAIVHFLFQYKWIVLLEHTHTHVTKRKKSPSLSNAGGSIKMVQHFRLQLPGLHLEWLPIPYIVHYTILGIGRHFLDICPRNEKSLRREKKPIPIPRQKYFTVSTQNKKMLYLKKEIKKKYKMKSMNTIMQLFCTFSLKKKTEKAWHHTKYQTNKTTKKIYILCDLNVF